MSVGAKPRSRLVAKSCLVACAAAFALSFSAWGQDDVPPQVASPAWVVRNGATTPAPHMVHVDFPEIHDFNSVVIKVSRRGTMIQFGYEVEMHGDGTILFTGEPGVVFEGKHRCSVAPEKVKSLVDFMRSKDYFSFSDKYFAQNVMDGDIHETSIAFDDQRKSVSNYMGSYAGMPGTVIEVENEIDRVAGSMRWIVGNKDTMACLREEHWNFRSQEAADTLFRLEQRNSWDLEHEMLAAGAGTLDENTLRHEILEELKHHDPGAASRLLNFAGSNVDLLHMSAEIGVPSVMVAALKLHPAIDERDWRGLTALMVAVSHKQYLDGATGVDRAWVARLLLEAGADPNLADKDGNTPLLMNRYDSSVVQYLLQAGANINARNNAGQTALMRALTPELTRTLILNHADPMLRDKTGQMALDIAKRENDTAKVGILTGKPTAHTP
jgi:ankyrin repeat protein